MEEPKVARRSDAITFVVFTFNEEARIEWAIKNFQSWGRVLVVDNYSTDKTVDIARSFGCDVLLNKNQGWVEDLITTDRVKAAVQTEWIYWGFADELVEAHTMNAILDAVECGKYSIVNVARKNYFYGQFCHDAFADRMNRVFKKDAIDFSKNTIHQFGSVTVPEQEMKYLNISKYYVHHFNLYYAKNYLGTMDRYSDVEARQSAQDKSRLPDAAKILILIAKTAKILAVNYLFKGGYKAGTAGFMLSLEGVYYRWLLAMKVYELQHGLDAAGIEERNNRVRSELMSGRQR